MELFYEGIVIGDKEIQHESLHTSSYLSSQKEQNESFSVGIPEWLSDISKNWTGLEVLSSNVSLPYFKLNTSHYSDGIRKVHKLNIGFDKLKETGEKSLFIWFKAWKRKRDHRSNDSTSPITD